jgi:phage regulator Rha-like protein
VKQSLMVPEVVEKKILLIRGQKVMLDFHLAELYGAETKALKRAVKRNRDRFPEDFCFELSTAEIKNLRYHFGTSSWGGRRYTPFAFTEQGVAMLSSVLNSKRAVQVNIEIMRAFVKLREILSTHKDLARKLEELEKKYDERFRVVFEAIRELMRPPEKPRKQIGFRVGERRVEYRVRRKRHSQASVRM